MRKEVGWRDWLIGISLVLASVQCVRADFLISDTFIDWRAYAAGRASLPYQARIGMVPVLQAAEASPRFRRLAQRYADSVTIGSQPIETITVEKFASLCAGIVALLLMMAVALWWSVRRKMQPWWLANVLVLVIASVTLVMRATQNYWYAYDLPHAALFGSAALFAVEGWWLPALLLFALDLPMRETAIFLVPVVAFSMLVRQDGRQGWVRAAPVATGMLLVWAAAHHWIARRFAANSNEVHPRLQQNLQELFNPFHWPQLFSVGGYLAIFIWLERRRLNRVDRVLLYSAMLCAPVTLYYGVWSETRVWLEWTLPLAALAAAEASARTQQYEPISPDLH